MTIQLLEQLEENFVENASDETLKQLAQLDCKTCHGQGFIKNIDYVPYGSTDVPMQSTEICDCIWNSRLSVLAVMDLIEDNFDSDQIKMIEPILQELNKKC